MVIGYLAILAMVFSLLEPQGLVWTLVTAGTGLTAGTAAFFLVMRDGQHRFTRLTQQERNTPKRTTIDARCSFSIPKNSLLSR